MIDRVFQCVAVVLTAISGYLTASWLGGIPVDMVDRVVMAAVGLVFTVCMVVFPGVGLRVGGVMGAAMVAAGVCMLGLSVFASFERLDAGDYEHRKVRSDNSAHVQHLEQRLAVLNQEIAVVMKAMDEDALNGYRARSLRTREEVLPGLRRAAADLVAEIKEAREVAGDSRGVYINIRAYIYLIVSVLIDVCAQLVILYLLVGRRLPKQSVLKQTNYDYLYKLDGEEKNQVLNLPAGVLVDGAINEKYLYQNRISQNRLEKDFGREKAKKIIRDLMEKNLVLEDKSISAISA